ncbi:YqgU-like beta propeller domain-containing protein [Litchfieldia salsa]
MRFKMMFVFVMTLLIVGCNPSHQLYENSDVPYGKKLGLEKQPIPEEFFGESKEIKSLDMNGEAFNTVGGWLDNESILYITDNAEKSNIYRYHIFNGKKELFFSSDSRILSLKPNEDHSLFLLHTSNSRDKAELIVIDETGKQVFAWETEAYDLEYVWSPYKKEQLFITTFLQDWSFKTFVMDSKKEQVEQTNVKEPFVQWLDATTVAYMSWGVDEPSIEAPLFSFDLTTGKETLLFDSVISFSTFRDLLLTVQMQDDSESYSFYKFTKPDTKEKLAQHPYPLLTNYSSWYIPYQYYNEDTKSFITFKPYNTGDFDTYTELFELTSYSLEDGKETTLLENVNSYPILFSENGEFGLYGYQYEMIIDTRNNKVEHLIND